MTYFNGYGKYRKLSILKLMRMLARLFPARESGSTEPDSRQNLLTVDPLACAVRRHLER